MGLELYCQGCDTTGGHDVDGQEAVCLSCGTVREIDPEALAGVVDMEWCTRCRVMLPVSHECSPDGTPCLRKTGLWPCGTCEACLAAQAADLAAREQAAMGSPPDYDTP
jgi:hypothetical protein